MINTNMLYSYSMPYSIGSSLETLHFYQITKSLFLLTTSLLT